MLSSVTWRSSVWERSSSVRSATRCSSSWFALAMTSACSRMRSDADMMASPIRSASLTPVCGTVATAPSSSDRAACAILPWDITSVRPIRQAP